MWKIDNNRIIDPEGRIYSPAEIARLVAAGKEIPLANNHHQQPHSYSQNASNNQNLIETLVALLNKDLPRANNNQVSTEADLTRIFVSQLDETTAQLIEFFSDGTSVTSNKFTLPRGKDGTPGSSNAYEHYITYEVNAKSFVFNDYNPLYDHCFYIYFSLLLNKHKIVGRLEVPVGLDPEYLVSNVALDYATTSSVVMLFDTKSKTIMAKNWSEIDFVISKIDVYRKLGIN